MSSTVSQVISAARNDHLSEAVPWGHRVALTGPGIYVVATTSSAQEYTNPWPVCPISSAAVDTLLATRPELQVDGERPSQGELAARISSFWLPDEAILYIGRAGTNVSRRVSDYYRTPIGARRPHAGGWFLKILGVTDDLWVHFAACDDPAEAENLALECFVSNVSATTREAVRDPEHAFPFANLEWPRGTRKRHGITGPRGNIPTKTEGHSDPPHSEHTPIREGARLETDMGRKPGSAIYRTQPVTGPDLRDGRIRIPRGGVKQLFPLDRCDLEIVLRGQSETVRWDPRYGPDQERSGVLGIRKALLNAHVQEGERLTVAIDSAGSLTLD